MSDAVAAPAAPASAAPASTGAGQLAESATSTTGASATETPQSPLVWDPVEKAWVHVGKVDGKESRRKWQDIERDTQRVRSADQRFEEAKAVKQENASLKQRQQMLAQALVNPEYAMRAWQEAGLDPEQMLTHMQRHLEAERNLTPEQKELRELRAEQQRRVQMEQQRQEHERMSQEQQAEAAQDEKYEKAFARHMDRAGVPAEAGPLREHLSVLLWGMHEDCKDAGTQMSLSEAMPQAMAKLQDIAKSVITMMSPADRAKLLGPDVITAIAQASVARAAPIPQTVNHHAHTQPRDNGKFSKHTTFRPGSSASFQRAADRGYNGG